MRLMSRRRYNMKAANTHEIGPCHHQRAGRDRRRIERQQHLEAQQRIERDVEQRPDSTAEIGVGPSACASGSQACNGARPTLVP